MFCAPPAVGVFDLDGTLALLGGPIPDDIIARLNLFSDKGVQIVFGSGMPVAYLEGVVRQCRLPGVILIGENGADMQLGNESCTPFEFDPSVIFPKFAELKKEICERFDGVKPRFSRNTVNFTVFFKDKGEKRLIAEVLKGHRQFFKDNSMYIDEAIDAFSIVPNEATKGNAIRVLAKKLGIDLRKFIAVGNDRNDVSMYEVVGTSVEISNSLLPLYEGKNHHVVINIHKAMSIVESVIDEMMALVA